MNDLDTLRNQLDSHQRDILTTIWHHYLKSGHWMPARLLHTKAGGKKVVRPILEQLGGSIVYEQDENGVPNYALTFTGVLLSSDGPNLEALLCEYLRMIEDLALNEPNRTHVSSEEALKHLHVTPDRVLELGRLLYIESFFSSSGSFAQNSWNAGLPKNIEDLPADPSTLIHEVVSSNYDPNVPLPPYERTAYYLAAKTTVRNEIFAFAKNKFLREVATRDWKEAKLCFGAKVWKFCVIACGSVLEAILLDVLARDSKNAILTLKALPNRKSSNNLYQWSLIDLVDVAAKLQIIGEASSHLIHALRLHRNLVHPGRQINESIVVLEEEAIISLNTVEKIIRDLSGN